MTVTWLVAILTGAYLSQLKHSSSRISSHHDRSHAMGYHLCSTPTQRLLWCYDANVLGVSGCYRSSERRLADIHTSELLAHQGELDSYCACG
jgi:hypothetical protein